MRQNLDPFDQNDDGLLNDALRASRLFSLQEEAGQARLTLDSKVSGGGSNLSIGQRQIIALARAMIRGSKLLILDEGHFVCFFLKLQLLMSRSSSYIGNWFVSRVG